MGTCQTLSYVWQMLLNIVVLGLCLFVCFDWERGPQAYFQSISHTEDSWWACLTRLDLQFIWALDIWLETFSVKDQNYCLLWNSNPLKCQVWDQGGHFPVCGRQLLLTGNGWGGLCNRVHKSTYIPILSSFSWEYCQASKAQPLFPKCSWR